ncbi:ribose transport system permease protein [Pseudomonas sp. SORGH_AS 211]|uniref:Sugar ABC transporter permease n=1 Tax=Pseudomonas oryzihabitans TaxID=47885 RepID=A0A2Z5A2S9_9PSED|nr:sugar ABC transporter permease [Pseudomonas oryzihabitans]MDR6180724.1 ribose transport system permease protein [Pseudomonas sp. SORGH_AS_0211]MDR6228106.1 ribose transport system permease protein [Pseudomonas sp. SORGH_AS_0199]QNQ97438.1 sugar ABC transporter permease [Pseudomonas psychrotolerans]
MDAKAPTASPPAKPLARLALRLPRNVGGPLIGLALLIAVFSFASEYFFSVRNALNILDQVTVLGILAIGMTLVIVIGGIDLSVGSVLAFSMMLLGWLYQDIGWSLGLAIPAAILGGLVCGLVSGLLIARARLPAFIATLTMMSVARGLANILTDGRQIVGFPDWFTNLATVRHFGFLSVTVGLFLLMLLVAWVFLRFRAGGRNLYAMGGSAEVARLSGIKVRTITIWIYALSGALAGLAAVAMAARLDSSQPSAGLSMELDAIAAVVIGGASLSGGVGSVGGTLVGVLIIGVLRNGLNLLGVSPFVQQVVIGIVIALAVTLDTLRRRNGQR